MSLLLALGIAAAVPAAFGALAPVIVKSRPRIALAVVVILPPLLDLVRYLTFVRAHDWEGMGGTALYITSLGWMIISFLGGVTALKAGS